jgi:penicillin-binding protein A
MRGFGQNEDQIVPLHMAMIAGAVANGGQMMAPYVVEAEIDHQGRVLRRASPRVWKTPLGERNAQIMTELMVQVSVVGTARCCIALENGISVASKTGTAQLNEPGEPERSHAWITAFAPAEDPQFAVAVMLKGTSAEISAGTGGQLAGPLAKRMLDAALATTSTAGVSR